MSRHQVSTNGETGRISLPSRFDVVSSAEFRIPFVRLINDANTRKVVVDFSAVSYIDSMGIGTLIAWGRNCQRNGKALMFDKCDKQVVNVLRQSGFNKMFAYS